MCTTLATLSNTPDAVHVATKQLALIQTKLGSIKALMSDLGGSEDDRCALKDEVTKIKNELGKLKMSLLNSSMAPDDPFIQSQALAAR